MSLVIVSAARESYADLQTNSQLAVTQSDVAGTLWTVWSRSTTGRLVARRESATGGVQWFDYGLPAVGVQCSTRGVAATSYVSGGQIYERAYCANSAAGGSIYEFAVNNGVPAGWRNLNLGGFGTKAELAATSIIVGGHWTLFVFFTAGVDDLLVWWQDVTVPGGGTVGQLNGLIAYSTTAQLAVSRAPGATPGYLHLFAARTAGTVDVWRRDAAFSASWNIGRPEAGVNAMGTAAVVEDNIVGGGSTYRVILFCTATVQSNKIYVAWANTASYNAGFAWGSYSLTPGNGNFQNVGYALAATSRSDGGNNRAIEAVALATLGSYPPQRLWRVRYDSAGFDGPFDIGVDGETGSRKAGLAAYPGTADFQGVEGTLVVFHGADADGTPPRLYSKDGTDNTPGDPWNWANHGDGEPTSTLTAGPLGETSAAFFDGRAIVAAINHPGTGGTGDISNVKTLWSSTDGDTWAGAWVEPASGYGPTWLTTDPTVDFDESGTAYLSMQALDLGEECNLGEFGTNHSILLYSGVGGSFPDPPTRVDAIEAPEHQLDHPFMAIYRDPAGNADRLHITWKDSVTDEVLYRSMPIGGALGETYVLHQGESETSAPYLTVGAEGAVYVNWSSRYCRIADDFEGCAHVVQQFDLDHQAEGTKVIDVNDGSDAKIATGSFALVASPTDPDVVYWVFQRRESDGTEFDIYSSTGQYSEGLDPPFDWTPPVLVTDHLDDDADQFAPGIAVTQYTSFMMPLVSVMWHDRNGGTCDGNTNRCFRIRRAVSYSNGVAYHYPQTIPIDTGNSWSDPAELPLSCLAQNRFLGHYRTVRGDLLHTRHIVVGSPNGGAANEAVLRSGWSSGGYYYW